MTVKETKYGWTFTMNPPCHVYTCANCPYRKGYCCMYESEKEERKKRVEILLGEKI